MDFVFRIHIIYDGLMKQSFDHYNTPLFATVLFLNTNPVPRS